MARELVGQLPWPLAHRPGGNAGNDGIGSHILSHHASSTADGSLADGDTWQDNHARAQPSTVANLYAHLAPPEIAGEVWLPVVVLQRVDLHVRTQIDIAPEPQAFARIEQGEVTNDAPPPTTRLVIPRISVPTWKTTRSPTCAPSMR